jgi:hypothetical protein
VSGPQTRVAPAAGESKNRAALVAAYREGLGLAAVAAIRGPAGLRVIAVKQGTDDQLAGADEVEVRWWCRRAADAEAVAAAAMARLRRRESSDRNDAAVLACEAIAAAAERLGIALYADDEIAWDAAAVIARIDAELDRLQQAGELKSINRSYRTYRMESSTRGEKVMRYAEWINKYKENLVRQLAAALR